MFQTDGQMNPHSFFPLPFDTRMANDLIPTAIAVSMLKVVIIFRIEALCTNNTRHTCSLDPRTLPT